MVRELIGRGYEVDGVDPLYPAGDSHGPNGETISAYWADTIFGENCYKSCCTVQYDLIVHGAYHVGGRAAIDGVNTNFAKNLQLDAALFEWAVRTKQKRVLYFSSSAAYPVDLQTEGYLKFAGVNKARLSEHKIRLDLQTKKNYSAMPDSNYGWAKLTGERLAEDARKNGLAVTVVRPFSGYGEDQSMDYPFPSIVSRASAGDLSVWGPKGQTRDWIHVSDVVNGALEVVQSGTADPVNLSTGRGVEMGELACMVKREATPSGLFNNWKPEHDVTYQPDKPTGVFYRVGDPKRLHTYYTPKVTLEEGIQRALKAQHGGVS